VFTQPLVSEFLEKTTQKLYMDWTHSKDSEQRETIWLQCQGIEAFRKFIEDTVVVGKMAQAELDAAKNKAEKGE
jgi:hypothetical protein